MVCPVCPAAGAVGGWIGGYFGINPPESTELRILSAVITAGLIVVSVVALKVLFDISICDGNGDFSLRNIVQVGVIALVMGIIHSLWVNYLINYFTDWRSEKPQDEAFCDSRTVVALSSQSEATSAEAPRPCCCAHLDDL